MRLCGVPWEPLSCEYAFFHAQRRSNRPPTQGALLPEMLAVIREDGQPVETDWPYLAQIPTDANKWQPPASIGPLFRRAGDSGGNTIDRSLLRFTIIGPS